MPPKTRAASGIVKRVVAESQLPSKRRKTAAKKAVNDALVSTAATSKPSDSDAPAAITANEQVKVETPKQAAKAAGLAPIPALPTSSSITRDISAPPSLIPPTLSFSLDDAKSHLCDVDPRFSSFFEHIPCRPFVHLEAVDPFKTLVTSIIGQQVSWLAARAINNRFRALFGFDEGTRDGFPTAAAVAKEDALRLKSVGLSTRKAEYVISLAQHFVSGQLNTELLHHGTDEEIAKALIAVRGIGQWTVDMFLMFSLRRPDVLAVGDLGVQKGLLRWVLSAHDALPPATPKKSTPKKSTPKKQTASTIPITPTPAPDAVIPSPGSASPSMSLTQQTLPPAAPETLSPVQPPPTRQLLRPSGSYIPPPLPADLSVETLRARLNGKKVKTGMYLTPDEMIRLTEPWRPFRSLGVFYMWPVAEE
ncbi:hypothetical protein IAT40_006122 [Kwoniella sp. CBS 6097]